MRMPSEKRYSIPNPALKDLDALIGEWDTLSKHPRYPGAITHGHVSFQWFDKGAFLVMYSDVEQPGPPSGLAIFGRDESVEEYSMLYFDERGVSRTYGMSLSGSTWKMWRSSPGFSQRFIGTFSEDNKTIAGKWELAENSSAWKPDLEVTYTRVK